MRQFITFILCLTLAIVCLTGCVAVNFNGGVIGKGDLKSYSVKVSGINEIKAELPCDINYHSSPSDNVTLEIQENLRDYVIIEESNGVLTVRATKNITNGKTPVLTVSTPNLSRLTLAGAGIFTTYDTIKADSFAINIDGAGKGKIDLDVNNLNISITGAGDFKFSGKADVADLEMSGAGKLDALPLQTRKASINLSGVGTVRLSCSDSLRINADGMGTVEYKGSPSIDLSKDGLVTIQKVE